MGSVPAEGLLIQWLRNFARPVLVFAMFEAEAFDTHIHMSWVRRVHHPFWKSSWNSLPLPSVLRLLEMVLPVTLQLLAASHGPYMFFFDIHVSCNFLAQASEPWSGNMHEIYIDAATGSIVFNASRDVLACKSGLRSLLNSHATLLDLRTSSI